MLNTFSIYYYVNGVNTYTMNGLNANDAYKEAIPGEALLPFDNGGRWHVLLKQPALERMNELLSGETLRVCWQHPPGVNEAGDTEHILIVREPIPANNENINNSKNIINHDQNNINNHLQTNVIQNVFL